MTMLFEIDTTKKIITVKEKCNLNELYSALTKLLGEDLKEYNLETTVQQIVLKDIIPNKEIIYVPQQPYIPNDPYTPFPNYPITCTISQIEYFS